MNGYIAVGLILIIAGIYLSYKKREDMVNKLESEIFSKETKIEQIENFCVKVKPHGDDMFCILFSNDGFKTFEEYEETLGNFQFCQVALFYTQESAIEKAKTLNTYQQCVDHNKIVKDRDKAWRDKKHEEDRIRWAKRQNREDEEVIITCSKP